MYSRKTVFAQLIEFLPQRQFRRIVSKYNGNKRVRRFTCWDQFLCMMFAQLTFRESLRDIEACLRALGPRTYHSGIRCRVARSTLADANDTRDSRIYEDFAGLLIKQARKLYAKNTSEIAPVYAIDSTVIELSLQLFPWARFQQATGGIKLHTQLELACQIPTFIVISEALRNDIPFLDQLSFEAGATYIMDRGYGDYERLYDIHKAKAYFVTRARKNMQYWRKTSLAPTPNSSVTSDKIIRLCGRDSTVTYPELLRLIRFRDVDHNRFLLFLTNNFDLPAVDIANLYKARWQIELFFKWIKQNLRIKAFYGLSQNAVKTQIWIAISTYVLIAIVRQKLSIPKSLHEMLQVLSLLLFEITPIYHAFCNPLLQTTADNDPKQLTLFTS